jgi:GxxExxY protein
MEIEMNNDIIYKTEVYEIVGVCIDVYNTLGYGFLEVVYKHAMEIEFVRAGLPFFRETEHRIAYKEYTLKHKFFTDFVLFNDIIVEVKVNADGIGKESISQTLNYLRAGGFRLGLVVNFGKRKLDYKRLIF